MNALKSTNGSSAEALAKSSMPAPKSGHPIGARSEAKKLDKRATRKKVKRERPQVKSTQKLEIGVARLPLLRKRRPGPQLHQAPRSPMSHMSQQALWIGG